MDRQHGHNLVAVQHFAALVAEEAAVAVAVQRDAEPRAGGAHGRAQLRRMLTADAGVDVPAVGGVADAEHRGAEVAQHAGAGDVRGAVGGVDHDAPAGEGEVRQEVGDGLDVLPGGVRQHGEQYLIRGIFRRGGDVFQLLLDLLLHLVGQFGSVRSEKLDAIVHGEIVRGRDDDTEGRALRADGAGHQGSRHDAKAHRRKSRARQAGAHRHFQRRSRKPRVPSDQHHPLAAFVLPLFVQPQPAAHGSAELLDEDRVDDRSIIKSAHAIGAEIPSFHGR